jgi:Family of unknown function (DUF1028)
VPGSGGGGGEGPRKLRSKVRQKHDRDKHPPVYSLEELSRQYLANLELALDAGRELGLRLYPLATEGEPLPERLVRALEAGQEAGGDKRGKQSAAVYTVKDQPYPYVDLRADEHPDPIVELRRIYEVVKVQMLDFIEALPTRRNPKGDFGEEIRGALIPNGDLPQADGEAPEEDVPSSQNLQTTP